MIMEQVPCFALVLCKNYFCMIYSELNLSYCLLRHLNLLVGTGIAMFSEALYILSDNQ